MRPITWSYALTYFWDPNGKIWLWPRTGATWMWHLYLFASEKGHKREVTGLFYYGGGLLGERWLSFSIRAFTFHVLTLVNAFSHLVVWPSDYSCEFGLFGWGHRNPERRISLVWQLDHGRPRCSWPEGFWDWGFEAVPGCSPFLSFAGLDFCGNAGSSSQAPPHRESVPFIWTEDRVDALDFTL